MIQNQDFLNEINNPVRKVWACVELRDSSSTLLQTFFKTDKLVSLKVDRVGEGKFFGFGVCQKLTLELLDTNREIEINSDCYFVVKFGYFNTYPRFIDCGLPYFYVAEVHRDEITNKITVIAYDKLYQASNYTTSSLNKYVSTFTVKYLADVCSGYLGLDGETILVNGDIAADEAFNRIYAYGSNSQNISNFINIDGTETFRELLDDIAEVTQTIYFIQNEQLCFLRLSDQDSWAQSIRKDSIFDFNVSGEKAISAITSTNELGDAVTASTGLSGTNVFVKDNMLWDLQEDIADLVDAALQKVKGFTMNQFNLKWRGNPLLTIGDRLSVETKLDSNFELDVYYINSTLVYDGGLQEEISWQYSESDLETANNPTSLGDVLNQTSAKVDKVNKEIELLVSNVNSLSEFVLNEDGITASVMEKVDNKGYASKEDIPDTSDLENRVKQAETQLSSDALKITIGDYIAKEGMIQEVITVTGFTFNEKGLTVEKANSEMKTYITEDGMVVERSGKPMLTANNKGVDAVNLKASTFLIVGYNSRFEDYKNKERTGCFWIGG